MSLLNICRLGIFCYTARNMYKNINKQWETLRAKEFSRLDDQQHVYVDYTGGGQCPRSVLEKYHELLLTTTFGNPHSYNPTSLHTTRLIEQVRQMVLEYFQANGEYTLIFTQNASGALKIIGESYPWDNSTVYVLARDNHNSVLGMREYAKRAGATVHYWELTDQLRLQDNLAEIIQQYPNKKVVVAFPAQSNFSGVMHPLDHIATAHQLGAQVILDTAAFVPTHPFSLKHYRPEAICVSFYKILGFPTGLGALIIRKDFLEQLRKAWFAGGTVRGVSLDDYVLEPNSHETFEDGTINYALIPALRYVFEFIESIGGIEAIEQHVTQLTTYALIKLQQLEQQGKVIIYGPKTIDSRGATIAFNILDQAGQPLHYTTVEKLAYEKNISLRGGCFCNPGAGTCALHLGPAAMKEFLEKVKTQSKEQAGAPGAVRISFGIANTMDDVEKVLDFIYNI